MRFLLLPLVIALASPSLAQTQDERDYSAERDRAVALAEAASKDPGDVHKRWMPVLEARLRRLIGPGVPKGFDGPSAMSPDALCCYIGRNMLDGIRFTTPDDQGAVLVSTEGLLQQWLKLKENPWWQPSWRALSADPARAILIGGPYNSSGVGLDAGALIHALLPITPPVGAGPTAAALMQWTQQGDANVPPEHIALVLFRGGRVYLALVKATVRAVPIAACAAIKAEFDKAVAANWGQDSDKYRRLWLEGDMAFEKCWTERAKDQPSYTALVRQAQALADRLAMP